MARVTSTAGMPLRLSSAALTSPACASCAMGTVVCTTYMGTEVSVRASKDAVVAASCSAASVTVDDENASLFDVCARNV